MAKEPCTLNKQDLLMIQHNLEELKHILNVETRAHEIVINFMCDQSLATVKQALKKLKQ